MKSKLVDNGNEQGGMSCARDNSNSAEHECNVQCKYDCLSHSYDIQHQIIEYAYQTNMIVISRLDKYDIVVEHVPEVRFIEFFSNIGGLLGMWLGISLLETLGYFSKMNLFVNQYADNGNSVHPVTPFESQTSINLISK